MSRLFEDSSDSSLLESQNHLLPSFSIWSMLLLRTSGLLLVGLILGLMVRRCHKLPLGRRQLWDILKCKQAESHMRARQVGQDYADGYDLWRAPTTSLLTSPSDEAVEPMETRVDQGPLEGLLRSPDSGITTLKELLLHAVDKNKGARALGQRKLVKVHKEKKVIRGEEREWVFYEKGPYEWLTYHEVLTQVRQIASGMLALGIKSRESVCVFLDTCREWLLMAHGCFHCNLQVATIYASLGSKGLSHALLQTESCVLFTDAALLKEVIKSLEQCKSLRFVIYVGEANEEEREELEQALAKQRSDAKDEYSSNRVMSIDQLIKIGKYNLKEVTDDPNPDDIALVMYTSGATGTPKGVLLSHSNFVAAVAGYAADLHDVFEPSEDRYLAYLPLSHVLEFTVEQVAIFFGIQIGYGTTRTLADNNMKNCKGDAKELKPTVMAGVPEVFERIRKNVIAQLEKQGFIARLVFNAALAFRSKLIEFNTDLPFIDMLAFRKVKQELGGELNLVASGAAPLSKKNQMFLRACFGVRVVQGYALTETAGAGTLQSVDDTSFSNVGRPNPCCELKLIDEPEMGYTSKDKEGPAGQILIRGPNVSRGYLRLEEKTAEDFKHGWFLTGDIGRWVDGRLYIVDRKKNLVKLSSGEYIALEKLETLYKESSLVENLMIHANTEENVLIAVVQPSRKALTSAAGGGDFKELCESDKAWEVIKKDFEEIAKRNGLSRVERVAKIVMDPEQWTPENGLVTATAKLNRQELEKKFKDQLEQLSGGKDSKNIKKGKEKNHDQQVGQER